MSKQRESDLSTLSWLVVSGADEAVEEQPQNRLVAPAPAPPPEPVRSEPSPAPPPRPAAQNALWQDEEPGLPSSDAAVASARHLAAEAQSIADLRDALAGLES